MAEPYEKMRQAIMGKDYETMHQIILEKGYRPNSTGKKDQRANLHTAVNCDDPMAISILLKQADIDTNLRTSGSYTPLMIACMKSKIEAIEVLLNDPRVDPEARSDDEDLAKDLIPRDADQIVKTKANMLFNKAMQKGKSVYTKKGRVALLICNSEYESETQRSSLPGAKRDQKDMEAFLEPNYTCHRINDMTNKTLVKGIKEVFQGLDPGSVTHLQIHCVGHGVYRNSVKEGRLVGSDGTTEVFSQQDAFGDALVGVDGSFFTTDHVLWLVLVEGKDVLRKDAKIFCIFDVCRDATRGASSPATTALLKEVKDKGFEL